MNLPFEKLFFVLLFLGYLCPSNALGHLAAATTSSLTPDTRAQLASPPPAIIGAHIVGDEYFEAPGPTPDPLATSISRPKVSVSATQTTTRTNVFATSLVRVGPRCVRRRRKLSAVIEKVTTLASPKPTVDDQALQPTPPPGLPSLRERTLMEMPDTAISTSSVPYGWQTGPVAPTDEDYSPPEQLSLLWMLLLICGAFTVALGGIIVKMDGLRGQRTAATEPEQVHTMPHEEPAQVAAPEDIDVAAEAFAQAAAAEGGFATGIQGQVVGDDVAEGPVLDDAGDGAAGDIGTKEPAQRDLGLAAATAVADECLRIMAHSSTARQLTGLFIGPTIRPSGEGEGLWIKYSEPYISGDADSSNKIVPYKARHRLQRPMLEFEQVITQANRFPREPDNANLQQPDEVPALWDNKPNMHTAEEPSPPSPASGQRTETRASSQSSEHTAAGSSNSFSSLEHASLEQPVEARPPQNPHSRGRDATRPDAPALSSRRRGRIQLTEAQGPLDSQSSERAAVGSSSTPIPRGGWRNQDSARVATQPNEHRAGGESSARGQRGREMDGAPISQANIAFNSLDRRESRHKRNGRHHQDRAN